MSAYQGQIWTPAPVVDRMLALRRNFGTSLEPCCGEGAISDKMQGCLALEVDASLNLPSYAHVDEFLDWPPGIACFATVIMNPPYVRRKGQPNLFIAFIEQAVLHLEPGGELICICPREWLRLTSARSVVKLMKTLGSITDWIEVSSAEAGWVGADIDTAIWRFEMGAVGPWPYEPQPEDGVRLGDAFSISVGAVPLAANRAEKGYPLIGSDRTVRRYGDRIPWIRPLPQAARNSIPRIFVNSKTRRPDPFFMHAPDPRIGHDGSLLALIPKLDVDISAWCDRLNRVDWFARGFGSSGRLTFQPKALEQSNV